MDLNKYETVMVILGVHQFYNNGEKGRLRVYSKRFWIHENFTMPSAENDLGIIELRDAVNFTEYIKPIKISTKKDIEDGKDIIAGLSGWGYKKDEHMPAEFLQTAKLKLISHEECIKFQGYFIEKVTKNNICAMGYNNQPGKAVMPCDGDSN